MKLQTFRKFLWLCLLLVSVAGYAQEAPETWMPDPALREAVREALELPAGVPLTKAHIQQLEFLNAHNKGIFDITGLELATNLKVLHISKNPITDLRPLANLTQLVELHFWHVPANPTNFDLRPLVNLINLETLSLAGNGISDITPLVGLKKLRELHIANNHIEDFSLLTELTNLKKLWIQKNWTTDINLLLSLDLIEFHYDEVCDFIPLRDSVEERIKGRSLPSAVQAWDHLVGTTDDNTISNIVLHDLYFSASHSLDFGVGWHLSGAEPTYGLSTVLSPREIDEAKEAHQRVMDMNPNIILLFEIRIHNHLSLKAFPSDSEHWLKNAGGNVLERPKNVPWDEYYIDLFNPNTQALLIDRIVAVANCGLFDGLFLDGFFMQGSGSNRWDEVERYADKTETDMIEAHATILEGVRERVREDFLILVNANRTKIPRYVEYVNGIFMETGHDSNGSYTREGIMKIEDTLHWAETHLRSPQINCLEGEGIGTEPPDGPNNLRWMRLFTTMSLTFSNGYVLYTDGSRFVDLQAPHHGHIWYDFWEADLGQPVGEKGQRYENREGLFIREFTNGWAVYNRSGEAQSISLPQETTGVASGLRDTQHTIPDLDGEIYLKRTGNVADLNTDGIVNILDLVILANAFGEAEPDLNGDDVVNILDLVIVADAFE